MTDGSFVYEAVGGLAYNDSRVTAGSWTDQVVEARVKVVSLATTSASRIGVMARRSTSYYSFESDEDGNITLRKSTQLVTGTGSCGTLVDTIALGEWHTFRLEVTGVRSNVRIRSYLDGIARHDCTEDDGIDAAGSAGVEVYGENTIAHFDDFIVTAP